MQRLLYYRKLVNILVWLFKAFVHGCVFSQTTNETKQSTWDKKAAAIGQWNYFNSGHDSDCIYLRLFFSYHLYFFGYEFHPRSRIRISPRVTRQKHLNHSGTKTLYGARFFEVLPFLYETAPRCPKNSVGGGGGVLLNTLHAQFFFEML